VETEFFREYQDLLILGIVCNILATLWFGFYKTMNMSEDQAMYLIEKYELNPKLSKTIIMWIAPFLGFAKIFIEVFKLQFSYLNKGKTVFQYVEDKIKLEKGVK
jgi:hypothetical protein